MCALGFSLFRNHPKSNTYKLSQSLSLQSAINKYPFSQRHIFCLGFFRACCRSPFFVLRRWRHRLELLALWFRLILRFKFRATTDWDLRIRSLLPGIYAFFQFRTLSGVPLLGLCQQWVFFLNFFFYNKFYVKFIDSVFVFWRLCGRMKNLVWLISV